MENKSINPQLEAGWKKALQPEFSQPYFAGLKAFLQEEKKEFTIFPPGSQIFAAFNHTPFDKVKLVILGQDPYHGPGQAHGLCFSVNKGVDIPPSLQNIYKELKADLGISPPGHGCLYNWAHQGVLLLNATLTVRAHQAGSHQNKGWERFTDAAIRAVSKHQSHIVFLLWGRFAQAKQALIDQNRHYVLTAPHPSPLSASRGFLGCRHFSKANALLEASGQQPIDWQLA